MANWKNRIVGQGEKPADQFLANEMNWRTHPENQRRVVRASLDTLGWVQQVIENKRTGRLIDGHERVWQALDNDNANVPYIEVDLSEEEEAQALATLDPITGMAKVDAEKIIELIGSVQTKSDPIIGLLLSMRESYTPLTGNGDRLDKTMDERLDAFLNTSIRQLVLYFDEQQFEEAQRRFGALRLRFGVESNTEALMRVFDEYFTSEQDPD